jgi:hypothetical protein
VSPTRELGLRSRPAWAALAALVGVLLWNGPPAAHAARAARTASLELYISFFSNGQISVTSPDGTPIGTTSGTPTIIPAGYYTLVFSGPGGCTILPSFHLTGPGANLISNMTEAQGQKNPSGITLLPSSTYTWSNDAIPQIVHTFTTSAQVEGSPPTPGSTGTGSSGATGPHVTSHDIVGSAVVPFRGALVAAVAASGGLRLTYHGKRPATLRAGTYTIAVTDRSATGSLVVAKLEHPARTITGRPYEGRRSASIRLTPGTWRFASGVGTGSSILVRVR